MVETHTISIVELHIALKRIIKDVQVQEVGNLLQGGILKPDVGRGGVSAIRDWLRSHR